jgi:uncharacterized protein (TIGR00645 family)
MGLHRATARRRPRSGAVTRNAKIARFAARPRAPMHVPQPGLQNPRLRPVPRVIFLSRWLQLPLYVGLIVAQAVYVWQFWVELVHLVQATLGDSLAAQAVVETVTPPGASADFRMGRETVIMLLVLGLIDVVMISNLLIMVIIGGYETFVSRMNLEGHPDQPEWLSHVNASVLKVKLATAIIGISSIHLLRTFINAQAYDEKTLLYQTVIHIAFLLSAMAVAAVDRILPPHGGERGSPRADEHH